MSTDALSPKTSMKRSALGIKTLNRNFAVLFSRSSSPSSSFSSPPSPPMTVAMNAFLCPGTAYWRRPKLLPAIARGESLFSARCVLPQNCSTPMRTITLAMMAEVRQLRAVLAEACAGEGGSTAICTDSGGLEGGGAARIDEHCRRRHRALRVPAI